MAKARGPSAKIRETELGKHCGPNGCESGPALVEIAVADEVEDQIPTLLVKGPMVPEIGWRTINGDQRRVRWEGNGYLNTNIKVEVGTGGIAGFGIPGLYALGTGNLETIDMIYSSFPGVREAAAFVVEDPVLGARMYAALVPEPGQVPDAGAFFRLSRCPGDRSGKNSTPGPDPAVVTAKHRWHHLPRTANVADTAAAAAVA